MIFTLLFDDLMPQSDVEATQEIAPPSTGKKIKARRVFGNILAESDLNCSLSYTPSPFHNHDEESDGYSSGAKERCATNLFSIAESKDSRSSAEDDDQGRKSESSSQVSCSHSESTGKIVYKPFANIMDFSGGYDKENNGSTASIPQSIRVPSEKPSLDLKLSNSEIQEENSFESSNRDSTAKKLACKTTTNQMVAVKPDKKQGNMSARSVNQAMNAARKARERALKEKARQAAMIRDQWREEKEEALTFHEESEKMRRQQLNLQNQLYSKFSKKKAQKTLEQRENLRREIDQESMFKSQVAREHQQKLKEQEEKCRRQSTAIRAKIRANNRKGAERLKLARIEEDKVIFEERQNFSKAREEYLKDRAASVRKNYQFRAGDARKIKELYDKMEARRKNEEHESFELMLAAARDVDNYKKQLQEQRRKSLAARNEQARKQREQAERERAEQLAAEHESHELKWAGESDADRYEREQEENRRKSKAFRNEEARKYRARLAEQEAEMKHADHQRYQLKFEGERDVEAYKREQSELRRRSLEQRGQFARNVKEKLSQQEARRLQSEHESYELKFAAEKDVEQHRRAMEELRRKSLEMRNKEAKRQRDEEENRRAQQQDLEHQSYELKWDGERDAAAYLKRTEEERRQSLKNRGIEARKHRELQDAQRTTELQAEHGSYELKRAACKDVDEYKMKMAQERRNSLAFRNKEKVRHTKVMDELRSIAKEQEAESYMLKWAGEDDAKAYLADLEEERRKSLQRRGEEARRHREIDDALRRDEIIRNQEDEALRSACKFHVAFSSLVSFSFEHTFSPYII